MVCVLYMLLVRFIRADTLSISFSFLDIGPLSKGHALVIPKCQHLPCTPPFWRIVTLNHVRVDHAAKLHELPDEYLADAMPIAKKIALVQGIENYNILQVRRTIIFLRYDIPTIFQNNGRIAHQVCLLISFSWRDLIWMPKTGGRPRPFPCHPQAIR